MVVKVDLLQDLDNPAREKELQDRIRGKTALRRLYHEIYESYGECLARCPEHGAAVELGSGGGSNSGQTFERATGLSSSR